MNKIIRNSIVLSLFCLSAAQAADVEKEDDNNPTGCDDAGYQFELQTLQLSPGNAGDNQSMYFLFNNSERSVSLYQMRDEESSRSMYMNHIINGHQWAVFSTSEKQVKFICTVPDKSSQYGRVVDCGENLKVCEYTNVRYGMNNRGNYWLVNSNTKSGAIREVVRYGIIPAN